VREEWGIVELHCSAVLWRACIWVETRSSPSVTAPPPVKSFQSSAAGIHQPFPFDSELGRLLLLFLDTGFASPTPLAFFAGTRLESRGSTVARTSYLILALYCVIDGDVPSGAEPETDDTHIKGVGAYGRIYAGCCSLCTSARSTRSGRAHVVIIVCFVVEFILQLIRQR
jgi:hypothetical protein